jgi:hypothetical protein
MCPGALFETVARAKSVKRTHKPMCGGADRSSRRCLQHLHDISEKPDVDIRPDPNQKNGDFDFHR